MKLNKPLVDSFIYEEKEFSIDLAFDNVLDIFDVLSDNTLEEGSRVEISLTLLLGEQDYEPSVDLWNYIYTSFIHVEESKHVEYDLKGNPMPEEESDDTPLIDLGVDGSLIYASFIHAYNIDLYEQQTIMKWELFQSLLSGLPKDTIMQRVIQIRAWKPSKGDSTEYKTSMKRLQKAFSLGVENEDDENDE